MILARGRYLVFAFFLILASGVFTALPASAASVSVVDAGITYTADDAAVGDGATVTSFSGSGAVSIPDTIEINGNDYDVVAIGDQAFQSKGVTAVTIGNNVETIGSQAFLDNQIASLNLGASVTSIGTSAFRTNALGSLTIPGSVTVIDDYAFNENQISVLVIGNGLATIGDQAFRENQLTTVTFPVSITSIGAVAFLENPGLASVIFTGPAPTVFPVSSGNRSFPHSQDNPNLNISYPWAQDVANGGGFSSPEWEGYAANAIRDEFTVNFDVNGHGSTPPSDQTVLDGARASEPSPEPTDGDWDFAGWYTDEDGMHSFDFDTPITADLTLYADWGMPNNLPQADVTMTISTACPLPPEVEGDAEPVYMQWSNVMYSYGFSGSRPLAPGTVVSGGHGVGDWHLQASIEGYQDLDELVTVTENGPNDFTFEMVPDGYDGSCDSGTDEPVIDESGGDEADNEAEAKDRTGAADDVLPATGSAVDASMLLAGLLLTFGGMFALTQGRGRRMI